MDKMVTCHFCSCTCTGRIYNIQDKMQHSQTTLFQLIHQLMNGAQIASDKKLCVECYRKFDEYDLLRTKIKQAEADLQAMLLSVVSPPQVKLEPEDEMDVKPIVTVAQPPPIARPIDWRKEHKLDEWIEVIGQTPKKYIRCKFCATEVLPTRNYLINHSKSQMHIRAMRSITGDASELGGEDALSGQSTSSPIHDQNSVPTEIDSEPHSLDPVEQIAADATASTSKDAREEESTWWQIFQTNTTTGSGASDNSADRVSSQRVKIEAENVMGISPIVTMGESALCARPYDWRKEHKLDEWIEVIGKAPYKYVRCKYCVSEVPPTKKYLINHGNSRSHIMNMAIRNNPRISLVIRKTDNPVARTSKVAGQNKSTSKKVTQTKTTKTESRASESSSRCAYCTESFADKSVLQQHVNAEHTCQKCGSNVICLADHMRDHAEDERRCAICNYRATDEKDHEEHAQQHEAGMIDESVWHDDEDVDDANQIDDVPFQCSMCSKKFDDNFLLQWHIGRVHKCNKCGEMVARGKLPIHKKTHDLRSVRCTVCYWVAEDKEQLDTHVALHEGKFKCSFCDSKFTMANNLAAHTAMKHTNAGKIQCDKCGLELPDNVAFKLHYATKHSEDRNHLCDLCPMAFKTKPGLRKHKQVHGGEKKYKCSICGKGFLLSTNMYAHRRLHTSKAAKKHKCVVCGAAFERPWLLKQHSLKEHSGMEFNDTND